MRLWLYRLWRRLCGRGTSGWVYDAPTGTYRNRAMTRALWRDAYGKEHPDK